jgi:hypothetical protein
MSKRNNKNNFKLKTKKINNYRVENKILLINMVRIYLK